MDEKSALEIALQKKVAELDKRDADWRIKNAEKLQAEWERSRAVALAVADHVLKMEGVRLPQGGWHVIEEGIDHYIYIVRYPNEPPCAQITLGTQDMPMLGTPELYKAREWKGLKSENDGHSFNTFLDAYVWARTGRK